MNSKSLVGLLVFVLVVCTGCTSKPPDDGLGPFEGDWTVLELNERGKPADEESLKRLQVAFKNGHFQQTENFPRNNNAKRVRVRIPEDSAVTVDPSKNPPEITFVSLMGPDIGKTRLGIYHLEDSKLTICRANTGEPRPTEFLATPTSILMVLERKK